MNNYETQISKEQLQTPARTVTNTLVRSVYIWMCTALLLSGATATLVAGSPRLLELIFSNSTVFWLLLIAQLGLVWAISANVTSFRLSTLSGLFMLYSVLTGITFSVYFLAFTAESIASTFFITAGTFAAMSVYGFITKTDLTKWGNLFLMGLIGIVIASIVNIFLHNETVYWIVTYAGVLIFTGLTAYDTQKIKALAYAPDNEHTQKLAICGALSLYLDFINLFIMLLRIFGQRK
ncbi:MAG: Bax inhibitor-1/YccA family protein [Odoribacter sp.]|nr:Bax inhibitor-1/YccA family protein [Odoribacter sp.]